MQLKSCKKERKKKKRVGLEKWSVNDSNDSMHCSCIAQFPLPGSSPPSGLCPAFKGTGTQVHISTYRHTHIKLKTIFKKIGSFQTIRIAQGSFKDQLYITIWGKQETLGKR